MGYYNEDNYYDGCTEELNVEACSFDGGGCKDLDCSTDSRRA
jgi:hypothetical protein